MMQMRTIVRRASILSTVAAFALAVSPAAAGASTTLSQTKYGSGPNWSVAATNAESNAFWALHDLAASMGETCTGVTYSNVGLYYIIPGGGGYVFSATATGACA